MAISDPAHPEGGWARGINVIAKESPQKTGQDPGDRGDPPLTCWAVTPQMDPPPGHGEDGRERNHSSPLVHREEGSLALSSNPGACKEGVLVSPAQPMAAALASPVPTKPRKRAHWPRLGHRAHLVSAPAPRLSTCTQRLDDSMSPGKMSVRATSLQGATHQTQQKPTRESAMDEATPW